MSTGKVHGHVLASTLRVFIPYSKGREGWLRRKSALILPPDTGIVQEKEILL